MFRLYTMTANLKPLARSPLHAWHAAHGAHLVERTGWLIPTHFSDAEAEAAAAKRGVGLADISPFHKLQLHGPDLEVFVANLLGDGSVALPGRVMALNSGAPCLGCRFTKRDLLLLSSDVDGVKAAVGLPPQMIAHARDVTMALAGFRLIGPKTESLLRGLTAFDVSVNSFPPGKCAETKLADVHAQLVRPPLSPFSELRIYIAADVGEYVWETLLAAGRDLGIVPLGLESLAALGFPQCL
jgi:glycine cleavage system aminomethyltransferase T